MMQGVVFVCLGQLASCSIFRESKHKGYGEFLHNGEVTLASDSDHLNVEKAIDASPFKLTHSLLAIKHAMDKLSFASESAQQENQLAISKGNHSRAAGLQSQAGMALRRNALDGQKSAGILTPTSKAESKNIPFTPMALEAMPAAQWHSLEQKYGPAARKLLQEAADGRSGLEKDMASPSAVFDSVEIALPLEPPILAYKEGTGYGQAQKNIAGLQQMSQRRAHGKHCVVYGLGIADDSSFEDKMGATGCETHAFDCTVDPLSSVVVGKHFKFHQWCIGQKAASTQNDKENVYVSGGVVSVQTPLPCEHCTKEVDILAGGPQVASYITLDKIPLKNFRLQRGINVVTVDPQTQQVVSNKTYDTYIDPLNANEHLVADLNSLPEGRIVLMAVHDTGLERLSQPALAAMRRVGASIDGGNFRESYALVGRVGQKPVREVRARDVKHKLEFKSLAETMRELGHTQVDLLKFDIEGYEWQLFQSEILNHTDRSQLPEQMSFELHTSGANPSYVPAELVNDKHSQQVGQLFASLYDVGYRVISKEINSGDHHCAEFVALRVN